MSSFWNWQPKKDYLILQLIRESNIHGIKYIAQSDRHIIERLFWAITVLLSIGASIFLSYNAVGKLLQSPVIVSFYPSQASIAKVPFPAVTICNVNRFRKSGFEHTMRMAKNAVKEESENSAGLLTVLRELDHMCDAGQSFSVRLNYSVDETTVNLRNQGFDHINLSIGIETKEITSTKLIHLFKTVVQSCEDMISLCLWEGEEQNCSELFVPILTDLGICCSFNMMPATTLLRMPEKSPSIYETLKDEAHRKKIQQWNQFEIDMSILDQKSTKPVGNNDYPRHQSKAGQGTGLSILLNPELDEYFCAGHDAFGFRLLPHLPIDWPHPDEYGLAVPPNSEMLINLMADITVADESIRGLEVESRKCVYVDEIKLDFFKYYTTSNCIDECVSKKIMKECTCLRFDLPQPPNNTGWTFCEGNGFKCSQEIKKTIGIEGTKRHCRCLPSCNQIEYRSETSTFPIEDNSDVWMKDGKIAKWAGKNVSIVHIFFGSDTVYSRVRSRLYGFNELFASVGGILGLFLGLSIMSLIEPFYFLVRLCIESESAARARTARATTARLFGETGKRVRRKWVGKQEDPYYNKMLGYLEPEKHPNRLHFLN